MPAVNASPGRRRRLKLVAAIVLALTAFLGAIGYFGYQQLMVFSRKQFTREAHDNLGILWTGVLTYAIARADDPQGGVGSLHLRGMPPSVPPSPNDSPGPIRQRWVATPGSIWEQLRFRPSMVLFVYSIVAEPERNLLILRAQGDQDGDGTRSTFEVRCHYNDAGVLEREPQVYVRDELE